MLREVRHPLIGFAPDLDFTTPGVIVGCNAVPMSIGIANSYQNVGFMAPPRLSSPISDALPAECRGAASVRKLDGSSQLYAGTQTGLYSGSTSGWTDVSKGGGYTGASDNRWRFAQVGNDTYAANKIDAMQYLSSGTFGDVGGSAPKAAIIEAVNGFLMAFNTNDSTNGDQPDRWWSSALQNPQSWSPSIATGAVTNRLTDTPGRITAAKRLGDEIIVYKDRSMYRGRLIGPPDWWGFELISSEIGALSQEAVMPIGNTHIFAAYDNIYYFDGSRPVPIGDNLRGWWQGNLNPAYAYKAQMTLDRQNSNLYTFYPDLIGNGRVLYAIVYNYKKNIWGGANYSLSEENGTISGIEAAVQYVSGNVTYDDFGQGSTTWDDLETTLPGASYDSSYFTSNVDQAAIFDTDHYLQTLTGHGHGTGGMIVTGWTGDWERFSSLMRVRPWMTEFYDGAVPTCTNAWNNQLGNSSAYDLAESAVTMDDGRFDFRKSARWHQLLFAFGNNFSMNGYTMYLDDGGKR